MKETKFTEAQRPVPLFLPFVKLTPQPSSLRFAVRRGLAKPLFIIGTGAPERKKYGGLGVPELRRLRQLEEENQQLKQLVADFSLDKQMLQDVLKKSVDGAARAGQLSVEGWPKA